MCHQALELAVESNRAIVAIDSNSAFSKTISLHHSMFSFVCCLLFVVVSPTSYISLVEEGGVEKEVEKEGEGGGAEEVEKEEEARRERFYACGMPDDSIPTVPSPPPPCACCCGCCICAFSCRSWLYSFDAASAF